jgi:hypothetical protein
MIEHKGINTILAQIDLFDITADNNGVTVCFGTFDAII